LASSFSILHRSDAIGEFGFWLPADDTAGPANRADARNSHYPPHLVEHRMGQHDA
jgi:hypothetical protein